MSLENLFKILPIGVVSKNDTGQCKQPLSKVRCIFLAAVRQPIASIKVKPKTDIPANCVNFYETQL